MQQTYPVNQEIPHIKINVRGDLNIEGTNRSDVLADFQRQEWLQVKEQDGGLYFECRDDLDLELPLNSVVEVEYTGGDAVIRGLQGSLKVTRVDGDLEIDGSGPVGVDRVGGDLDIQRIAGDLAVNSAGGDAQVEDVTGAAAINKAGGDLVLKDIRGALSIHAAGGDCSLKRTRQADIGLIGGDLQGSLIQGSLAVRRVGGDVDLEELQGDLALETAGGDLNLQGRGAFRANVGGDADIELEQDFPGEASLNAGGDIDISLSAGSQARLEIASGGGSVSLDLAGERTEVQSLMHRISFGSGSHRIVLRAGGDVQVESPDRAVAEGTAWAGFTAAQGPGTSHIPNPEEIEAQVLASTRHVAEQIESARQRLEKRGIFIPGLTRNLPPTPQPEAKNEPVGEDERLIILRMLQDKKITIEEAEQLLEALDAQDLNTGE